MNIDQLIPVLREILLANELGGDIRLALCFSDPDGVRTGKSGYSFGVCQFDLQNNPDAKECLKACNFSDQEIASLIEQACNKFEFQRLNEWLALHAEIIGRWDGKHIAKTVRYVDEVTTRFRLEGPEAFLHLCDYHNQFFLSRNGKCDRHLQRLNRVITPQDILDFKLTTLWGRKRPDDVKRRFDNVARIVKEHQLNRG